MPAAMWDMNREGPALRNAGKTRQINDMATGYSYTIKGGPAPPRPPRDYVDSQFETAPPVQEPPPRNPRRNIVRNSETGPPTSLHAQPRATAQVYTACRALQRQQDMAETVSPPSSPEPDSAGDAAQHAQGGIRDRNVSPIGGGRLAATQTASRDGGESQPSRRTMNNIPMMRRMRRRQSDAALREAQGRGRQSPAPASGQQRGEVRYDAMTGEPTASAAGRPPHVRPAEYAQGLGISTGPSPPQRSPSAMMTAFGDRVRRMRQSSKAEKKAEQVVHDTDPAANAFTSSRPGWRGASGRTTIVEPVRDHLEVAPLRLPAKNATGLTSPTSAINSTPMAMTGQTPPVSPPGSETVAGSGQRQTTRKALPSAQTATPAQSKHRAGGPSYPSPPPSGSFDRGDVPSVGAEQLQSPTTGGDFATIPSAGSQQKESAIHRKPPATHAHQEPGSSPHAPAPPLRSGNPNTGGSSDPWSQPASRFSITTYATSAAPTPHESLDDFDHNRPPLPETHPLQRPESPQPQHDEPYMTSPYETPPSAAAQERMAALSNHPALRIARARPDSIASSINKTLPPAPPETSADEASDRVGMLNARLQGLGNRRINITRSIKQMTELMPTDSIMDSAEVVRRRDEEKRKVEALRMELAEVQREEYELALKLHRAYKRMDRDASFEPTTLWVKRVTG